MKPFKKSVALKEALTKELTAEQIVKMVCENYKEAPNVFYKLGQILTPWVNTGQYFVRHRIISLKHPYIELRGDASPRDRREKDRVLRVRGWILLEDIV